MNNKSPTVFDAIRVRPHPASSLSAPRTGLHIGQTLGIDNEWIRALACLLVLIGMLVARTSTPDFPQKFFAIGIALVAVYVVTRAFSDITFRIPVIALYFLLFVLFVPDSVSLSLTIQTVLFGLIFGEIVFGGRGFSFLHPVLAGLCLLLVSHPEVEYSLDPSPIVLAFVALASGLLLWFRCIDLRVIVPLVLVYVIVNVVTPGSFSLELIEPIALAGIVLLLLDPAVTPTMRSTRTFYGLTLGLLLYLFGAVEVTFRTVVLVGFFVGLLSPLMDWIAVRFPIRLPRSDSRETD